MKKPDHIKPMIAGIIVCSLMMLTGCVSDNGSAAEEQPSVNDKITNEVPIAANDDSDFENGKITDTTVPQHIDANNQKATEKKPVNSEKPIEKKRSTSTQASETFVAADLIAPPVVEVEITEDPTDEPIMLKPSYSFHEYKALDEFLGKYVSSSGKVKYKAILKHRSELDSITNEFKNNAPSTSWTKSQKLSFWINAYNIFTIQLIIDHYPVNSINDINKPFDTKFITIGTKKYSLNDIEKSIIQKQFNEPRIHFVLNCASESCPVLLDQAYKAEKLENQLENQTRKFIRDQNKNEITAEYARLSKIFEWYRDDFKSSGGLASFINRYSEVKIEDQKISYLEYDWSLNEA